MNRREMIGTMGLGAAALTATGMARAQQERAHAHGQQHEGHLQTLANCARICNETAHHCLEKLCTTQEASEREAHARIHEATMDCQAFCVLTATLMARHSPMSHHAHLACAEACAQCAQVCQDAGTQSEEVKACIEACKACEKACRTMAEQKTEHHHHDHGAANQPAR